MGPRDIVAADAKIDNIVGAMRMKSVAESGSLRFVVMTDLFLHMGWMLK